MHLHVPFSARNPKVEFYPVERMMATPSCTEIFEGTNQIQRVVIARELLR